MTKHGTQGGRLRRRRQPSPRVQHHNASGLSMGPGTRWQMGLGTTCNHTHLHVSVAPPEKTATEKPHGQVTAATAELEKMEGVGNDTATSRKRSRQACNGKTRSRMLHTQQETSTSRNRSQTGNSGLLTQESNGERDSPGDDHRYREEDCTRGQ